MVPVCCTQGCLHLWQGYNDGTGYKEKQCVSLILRQGQLPDTPPYSASDSCSPPQIQGEFRMPGAHLAAPPLLGLWVVRKGAPLTCAFPQVHAAQRWDLQPGGLQLLCATLMLALRCYPRSCRRARMKRATLPTSPAASTTATQAPVILRPPQTIAYPAIWG